MAATTCKLRGALVDVGDAHIAIVALHVELAHKPRAAVHLDGLVADPVAHLGGIVLGQGQQDAGHAVDLLELLAPLGIQLAFAFQVLRSTFSGPPSAPPRRTWRASPRSRRAWRAACDRRRERRRWAGRTARAFPRTGAPRDRPPRRSPAPGPRRPAGRRSSSTWHSESGQSAACPPGARACC